MMPARLSRAATGMVFVLCFGVAESSIFGGLLPEQGQVDDDHAKAVLKLQAEKRDSMDRLEKNAAEIARKWREREAQKQASNGGQSQKSDGPGSQAGGGNANAKESAKEGVKEGVSKASEEPEGANPLQQFDSGEVNTPSTDAAAQTTNSVDTSASKTEAVPSVGADPVVRVASVSGIVDGPIDRLALATSLYATNQLRECLKILEAVELRPLSVEDRQWHDYLVASCYRKLGNRSEAEDYYRSVLQRSSSTWVSTAARWWLGHIDETSQLKTKLEKVQTTVANWRKEIDVLKSAD